MDVKAILIENTLLKLERGKDSGITEEDMKGVIETLKPLLKQTDAGSEITYIMPLDEAVSYELSKIIAKRVIPKVQGIMHMVTPEEKAEEDKELGKAAEAIAAKIDSKITKEAMMEAQMHQGEIPPAGPIDLYSLADRLTGEYLEFNDQDLKTIRIAYKKITGTTSKDEADDLKTIIECMKGTPEDLEEHAQLTGIINKLKEQYA